MIWDGENRLSVIALPAGAVVTSIYDATGLRRQREDASGVTKYLWDGVNLLAETNAGGTTQARYTAALGQYGPVVSQRRSGVSAFYHADALGTINRLTDASQNVTDTYVLDAWGRSVSSSGSTTNPHRYIGTLGYYHDTALGLDYVRARWLRPTTGSWLSVDPVLTEPRYGYVGGKVTRAADPGGQYTPGVDGPPVAGYDYPLYELSDWSARPPRSRSTCGVGIGWEVCFGIGHGEELIWCHDEWGRWRCYPWSKDIVGPPSASMGLIWVEGLKQPSDYGGPFREASITPLLDVPVYGSIAVAPNGVVSVSTGVGVGPPWSGQQSVYYPPDEHWIAGPVIRRIEREEQRILDRSGFPGGPRYAPPPRQWPPWADWLWPWR